MPDEYVTKLEMTNALSELRSEMKSGFSDVNTKLNQIINAMELKGHTDRETYDERYILREESMAEAIARVGTPLFRQACHPIANEYLESEEGKMRIGCMIDRHLENKRDSATKWINFVKLISGIALATAMLWGGNTVVKSNVTTQRAVIDALKTIGE